jgi:DNA-directed RNA polymerase II subunit RPB2
MPHNKNGIRPDIILNPNAIPSRQTIGQLLESVIGKVSALEFMEGDGTPFEDLNMEIIENKLKENGYDSHGYEELYNGMTGEKMKVKIFFGPTYYQRLKHMVQDKLHSRPRGPRTLLTRQPPEGRIRDGGLRLGEMERDALIGHGIAKFLHEKTMYDSDAYATYICDICGLFAQRAIRKNIKKEPSAQDIYYCTYCNNSNYISKIMIPYAFKLLMQELMAMNIAPRIRTKKIEF